MPRIVKHQGKTSKSKLKSLSRELVEAAKRDDAKEIERVLSQGADVHFNNDESLYAASWRGKEMAVRVLLKNGADATARNCAGAIEAARLGHRSIVERLVKSGASRDALDIFEFRDQAKENQKSWWATVIKAAREGRSDLVGVLLSHYPKFMTPGDYAALVVEAAMNEHSEVVDAVYALAHYKQDKPLQRRKKQSLAGLKSELRRSRTEINFLRLQNEILKEAVEKFCRMLRQKEIEANTASLRDDPAIKMALLSFKEGNRSHLENTSP